MKMITYAVTLGFADDTGQDDYVAAGEVMAHAALGSRGVLHAEHSAGEHQCVICGTRSGVVADAGSQLGVCPTCLDRLSRDWPGFSARRRRS